MGGEGMPTNTNTSTLERTQEHQERVDDLKNHREWGDTLKRQMAQYGSPENSHYIYEEYGEYIDTGEITFKEALKRYAEDMTTSLLAMKEKQKKLEKRQKER
jgi:hypothetical protein